MNRGKSSCNGLIKVIWQRFGPRSLSEPVRQRLLQDRAVAIGPIREKGNRPPLSWDFGCRLGHALFFRREIGIKKAQSVGWLDDPGAGGSLLIQDFFAEHLHFGPMNLRFVVVLRVITIVEPNPVIKFVIATDAPSQWHVRVAAIVEEVTVQIGKTMPQIIKRQEEKHELPLEHEASNDQQHPGSDLEHPEFRIERASLLDVAIDRFRVVAKKTEEGIAPGALRLAVVPVFVN